MNKKPPIFRAVIKIRNFLCKKMSLPLEGKVPRNEADEVVDC